MGRCLVDVDATRLSTLEYRALLYQVVRHPLEVGDEITNRILALTRSIRVHHLRQIGCIDLGADMPQ